MLALARRTVPTAADTLYIRDVPREQGVHPPSNYRSGVTCSRYAASERGLRRFREAAVNCRPRRALVPHGPAVGRQARSRRGDASSAAHRRCRVRICYAIILCPHAMLGQASGLRPGHNAARTASRTCRPSSGTRGTHGNRYCRHPVSRVTELIPHHETPSPALCGIRRLTLHTESADSQRTHSLMALWARAGEAALCEASSCSRVMLLRTDPGARVIRSSSTSVPAGFSGGAGHP